MMGKFKEMMTDRRMIPLATFFVLGLVFAILQTFEIKKIPIIDKDVEGLYRIMLFSYLGALGVFIFDTCKELNRMNNSLCFSKVYDDVDKYYNFLTSEVYGAKEIHTINLIPNPPKCDSGDSRDRYHAAQKQCIKHNKLKITRILSVQTKAKYQWLMKDQLEDLKEYSKHSVGYIDIGSDVDRAPLLTFIIFDGKKVCFGLNWKASCTEQQHVCIESESVGKAFMEYYKILYQKSVKLKDINISDEDMVKREHVLEMLAEKFGGNKTI